MSKVDALRALREAKYAADRAAAPAGTVKKAPALRPSAATASVTKPASKTSKTRAATDTAEPEVAEAQCGHRNMGGKSCTRPEGHSEKNHRYS